MKAEEFIDYCDSLNETAQFKDYLLSTKQFERTKFLMKKYAELKCKELLEIVAEKAEITGCYSSPHIDKDSILNAVDLKEFIK
jgi:hypothetical protein